MKTQFKIGDTIKCIENLDTICNGIKKDIFTLNKIYVVQQFQMDMIGIKIRDNGDGYTFFDNSVDKYFQIV